MLLIRIIDRVWLMMSVLKTDEALKTSVGSNPTLSSSAKGIALT